MPQVAVKMFFLDDPNWPTPPAGGGPLAGSLTLLGVGRMFWLVFGLEVLWKALGS